MINYILAILRAMESFGVLKSLSVGVVIIIGIILLIFAGLQLGRPFLEQIHYELGKLEDSKITNQTVSKQEVLPPMNDKPITTGDISVTNNLAPTQINIGSTGSTQIVNQQRLILRQAKVEKGRIDNTFITRIILEQTTGIWDQGVEFQVGIKTSGPYESARIIRGLPPAQMMVKINENKNEGRFFYSTATAPVKNEPIIVEIKSFNEIGVEQLHVSPVAD